MVTMDSLDLAGLSRDGWAAIGGLLTPQKAEWLAQDCASVLADQSDVRPGDKRAAGTRHAAELLARLPSVAGIFDEPRLAAAVTALLGTSAPVADVQFRCPQPGFGEQSLHADDVPIQRADETRGVTCIVALCEFTERNGATVVVPGSHRRPDLQRKVQKLDLVSAEVNLTGPAGTAFVFSAHLLHRGARNRSGTPRPALQAHFRLRGSWSVPVLIDS
ncbi:MAG: phytanoyl-CoA dioxygenase family protein [Actinomycetota bacterium]|nr:phytanoyl-CoA dioxygenase family protein [Actinomycetota bacterium]